MFSWRMTSPYSPWMSIIFSMVRPTNSRLYSKYSCWNGIHGVLT